MKNKKTWVQKDLNEILSAYKNHWKPFTRSPHCFLSEQEVIIIELCYQYGSIAEVAKIIGWSNLIVSKVLNDAKRTLRYDLKHYENWVRANYTLTNGIKRKVNTKDLFLFAPFKSRYFSKILARNLFQFSDTVIELLSTHGEKQLLMYRGFGKKKLQEFIKVLREQGCREMLCYDIELLEYDKTTYTTRI